jgi:flagellar basal-body rod protein FlgF
MNSALYAAFLGMRARQRTLDVLANNIANASTTGFKAERTVYRSIEAAQAEAERAQANSGQNEPPAAPGQTASNPAQGTPPPEEQAQAAADRSSLRPQAVGVVAMGATDFSSGPIRETSRALDVALAGDGFLVVQTPLGERYTRSGSLTLDAAGQLVTQQGQLIVGEGGPITIPPGEVSIGEDGTVSVNGQALDRLKLVRFGNADQALAKQGDSLFMATGKERPQQANDTRVIQGALEASNVNSVTEMVAMMQNNREFDSLQRSITLMMNDIGRKVAGELGKI